MASVVSSAAPRQYFRLVGLICAVVLMLTFLVPKASAEPVGLPVVTTTTGQQVQVTIDMAECGLMTVGTQGTCVVSWQYLLNRFANAGLAIDGDFGAATQAATVSYQQGHGLSADGVVGDETRQAIATDYAVSDARLVGEVGSDYEAFDIYPGEERLIGSDLGQIGLRLSPTSDNLNIDVYLGPLVTNGAVWGAYVWSDNAEINYKKTRWNYPRHVEAADYVFHSHLKKFQNRRDAPWTDHTLKAGDVVHLKYHALVPQVDGYVAQVEYEFIVAIH